jgi:hypothetical protein
VQWQVSTNAGASYANIANATTSTLTFETVQSENGGLYRAVFTNASGSTATSSATLTVGNAPDVTLDPVSQQVNAGDVATFTAAATGSPAPTVVWEVSTNSGSTFTEIPGADTTTLSITTASTNNGDEYEAIFTNSSGSVETSIATLTVVS